ncbi:MAG: tRNA preQ1(34) S-adenosylmethionine ribosyltransferase-isomerase QueA [Pseudomonadota bacterium]
MSALDAFDFVLPEDRIALRPVDPQDAARLLVVHRDGRFEDASVRDLPAWLSPGDTMVFNDTRVIAAALKGVRRARDAHGADVQVDVNLVERRSDAVWRVLARPGKRLRAGDRIAFSDNVYADIVGKGADGDIELHFSVSGLALDEMIERAGRMPLPPYIERRRPADRQDRATYQTSFASEDAQSVAAPTAGLHFTPRLLSELKAAGVAQEMVRLNVGLGTFAPLKPEQIETGTLHEEWRQVSAHVASALNRARESGHRCIAVGTTALRTLESSVTETGEVLASTGPTDIFIQPGYRFKAVDALLTNFHLPRSSLFMLVCALMGTPLMQAAYAHAIAEKYRFYSYGDACLLLP